MASIEHVFTNQGGSAGAAEIADYLNENVPNIFGTIVSDGDAVNFKNGNDVIFQIFNGSTNGAGLSGTLTGSHAMGNTNLKKISGVIIDPENETVTFIVEEYAVLCTICKNENGEVCCVYRLDNNSSNILADYLASENAFIDFNLYIANFDRDSVHRVPLGVARTTANCVSNFPLLDWNGVKIAHIWLAGSSALRSVKYPIQIKIGDNYYYSIGYGSLLQE